MQQISRKFKTDSNLGFTIVELLVVIVVIGILAAITMVSYSGVSQKAKIAALQSDLSNASTQLKVSQATDAGGNYPTANNCPTPGSTEICLKASNGNTYTYAPNNAANPKTFTLKAVNGTLSYQITNDSSPAVTVSVVIDGSYLQTVTSANCPSTRIRAVDARDSHTYWVQKLADGKCWMLTNLGYAGSGTNTYSDVRTLTNGTGGSTTYTVASYYVIPSTINFTTEPTAPSTSTDGTGQYGYLYNWCAAMGGQASAACANAETPTPDLNTNICPSGWRLPTGDYGDGEFTALNTAINGGLKTTSVGLRDNPWLAQRSGWWQDGFGSQGSNGSYWSSTQSTDTDATSLSFNTTSVNPSSSNYKYNGAAVRCIAL